MIIWVERVNCIEMVQRRPSKLM